MEIIDLLELYLDERRTFIIKNRFGIECKQKTLAAVGKILDPPVTPERVRQQEAKALRTLRARIPREVMVEHQGTNTPAGRLFGALFGE